MALPPLPDLERRARGAALPRSHPAVLAYVRGGEARVEARRVASRAARPPPA